MNAPLVTFCIPTYNRSRYLDSLLGCLVENLASFPHSYEIFVSDNASDDDTPDIVANYRDRLPLRYVRHAENRGGRANWQYMMANAAGMYVVYVADDDAIMGDRVADVITVLQRHPQIAVAYAPWKLLDLVANKDQGQFYRQDKDILIQQHDYAGLLDTLLTYRIFPEIYIARREVMLAMLPRIHEQVFYAFVHAADFVQRAAVLFLKDPFYVAVTNYFADHQREQGGNQEAEVAWDRYRAGLEYVLGRAGDQFDDAGRLRASLRIQEMLSDRISVAVRLRLHARRDPVETYYLAYRLKAMNAIHKLPLPMDQLRSDAALGFLCSDPELNRGVARLVCVGDFDAGVRTRIESLASVPVLFETHATDLTSLNDALVLTRNNVDPSLIPTGSNVRVVAEQALMQKFHH
jgi:glycosyltransferase involved in cell wall biosynthesis